MAGKKVLYVHGFMSSAQSGTVHLLKELMPQAEIIAEDLPLHPQEALDMLRELAKASNPILLLALLWVECSLKCFTATTVLW